MNINVNNLQSVIKKATLNYVIPSVHLNVSTGQIISKMRSQSRTVVISLNLPNDVITDLPDSVDFNFDEPNVNVKPYLNLIDNDICQLDVGDAGLKLKDGRHKTNLFFCMPSTVTTFTGQEPETPSFFELTLTDEIKGQFDKIRKIAGKFEVVYFSVKDKKFIIEATDRTNRFTNGISFELADIDHPNVDICLEYKNFNALLQVIDDSFTQFSAKFTWMETQEAGMVTFAKNDDSEKYYILHHLED
jgi:hypothetical protein